LRRALDQLGMALFMAFSPRARSGSAPATRCVVRGAEQHDHSRERSYTLVSEYHHGRDIYGRCLDPIEDDIPGIKQICRSHMIPTE
jgi:hypothetical protein